jgi:hypothetical protein
VSTSLAESPLHFGSADDVVVKDVLLGDIARVDASNVASLVLTPTVWEQRLNELDALPPEPGFESPQYGARIALRKFMSGLADMGYAAEAVRIFLLSDGSYEVSDRVGLTRLSAHITGTAAEVRRTDAQSGASSTFATRSATDAAKAMSILSAS